MSRKVLIAIISSSMCLSVGPPAHSQVQTAAVAPGAQSAVAQAPTSGASVSDNSNSATPTQVLTPVQRREKIHRVLFAIAQKQKNVTQEEVELGELISVQPTNPDFHQEYGLLMMEETKYPEAIQHFDDAIKVDPDYANAYAMKGECYAKQKKYKEAIEEYTKAQQHAKAGHSFRSQIAVNEQLLERYEQEQKYLQQINKRTK